jgi:pyruvate,water dikinase
MTTLPRRPEIEVPAEGFWEKDDWHYPTPMTAFGASVYLPSLEHGLATQCREFGILAEGEQQRWIGHEVYGRTVPYRGKPWPRWPWWFFGLVARISPELRRRTRIADRALRSGLAERYLATWESEWREAFRREASDLRGRDLEALDDVALLDHLERAIDLHRRGAIAHFRLNTPYGLAVRQLYEVCRELIGWDPPQTLSLLAGASGISSEPGRELSELAQLFARSPAVSTSLDEGSADLVDRLREATPEAADALAAYVDAYGHRPIGYDPGDATLAERFDLIVGLLRDRMGRGDPSSGDGATRVRDEAIGRARAALAGRPPVDRERFERAYAAAWRAYHVREESIFYGDSLPSGVLRYTALEIGRRLVERHLLDRAADAIHLTADELRRVLRNGDVAVRDLVARRLSERAWVIDHPGPPSYGREEGAPPDLRGVPRALRHFNRLWLMPVAGLGSPSTKAPRDEHELVGAPGSPGRYSGTARVVRDDSEFSRLRPGEVLVCPIASPAWSVLFAQAGAVVTDAGGASSHAGIIAREYGIPAVLGTRDATRRLGDGQVVTVDGTAGLVTIEIE